MRNCNNCKYCIRHIELDKEVLRLKFLCSKRDDLVIDTEEMSTYDFFSEPACNVEEKDCPLSSALQVNVSCDTTADNVNHPSHYTWLKEKCGIEVIDITRHFCFDLGNALKYLLRAGHKTDADKTEKEKEIEDLKKAVWYIKDYIAHLE